MNNFRNNEYQERINQFQIQLNHLVRQHGWLSLSRLLLFLTMAFSWSWLLMWNLPTGIIAGLTSTIGFFTLIKYHQKIEQKRDHCKLLLTINQNELASCTGDFSMFDGANQRIDHHHRYSYDIDLFGNGSIFQYINRTCTSGGEDKLANWLTNTPLPNETIINHQLAINELTDKIDHRHNFQATGMQVKITFDENSIIQNWLNLNSFFPNKKPIAAILYIFPLIAFLVLILVIFGIIPYGWLVAVIFLNLSVIGTKIKAFNLRNDLMTKAHSELRKTGQLINLIETEHFQNPFLNELKRRFFHQSESANQSIFQLTKLLNALDNRNNILVGFILNAFLLWDWQCIWRIEKWQKKHLMHFDNWSETLAYFDALNSLANMAFNNPDFCYPEITEGAFVFEADELGHPLILKTQRICNTFTLHHDQRFAIVTGANMAGKSTFLRTIAVNLILAQAGAPVCASRMKIRPVPLFSSMRAEDSLMKHESYFFAELKRLQAITQVLDKNQEVFIILDEILRGTNSEDKRKGSIGFVTKITRKKAFGLIATHDLELARLAANEPEIFKALCFEVRIENNQLIFDYKLQPGVTQNMNASFLMEQMGIIGE